MAALGWWKNWFGNPRDAAMPLYEGVVQRARDPRWYLEGGVPDTLDGRFDMLATVLALVLLRLEQEPAGAEAAARLAERFVDDMDPQLREIGIGDLMVGKHIGRMIALLGGRIGAYREGLAAGDLGPALVRNLYRGHAPGEAALAFVRGDLASFADALARTPLAPLLEGKLP